VAGSAEISEFTLRATSTYRKETDTWRLVLRHADPISTFNPTGPLRTSRA
jgi:ketosteroid isomerase-like protein